MTTAIPRSIPQTFSCPSERKARPLHAQFTTATAKIGTQIRAVNEGLLHRHFATDRYSLLTSLPMKLLKTVLDIFVSIPLAISGDRGYKARWYWHRSTEYILSDSSLKPLVRTMNLPNLSLEDSKSSRYSENQGVCVGSSLYFNHLFEHSGKSRQELIQIANQFVFGAPLEACQLHSVGDRYTMFAHFFYADDPDHLFTLIPESEETNLKKGRVVYQNREGLLQLGNGTHLIRIAYGRAIYDYHALSLIKLSNELMYIFDPGRGLFEFEGLDIPKQINEFFHVVYKELYKYHTLCYYQQKLIYNDLSPTQFAHFHIQIAPCFPHSPTFTSPDPKNWAESSTTVRQTKRDYLYDLFFERIPDCIKNRV